MKTKTTLLKLSLLALFLFSSSTAWSQIEKTYYTCINTPISLVPEVIANVSYTWSIQKDEGSIGTPEATLPQSFDSPGKYTIRLISTATPGSGICAPDVAESTIIVLPAIDATLTTLNASFCEGDGDLQSSTITPTTGTSPYPSDIELEYSYTVTLAGATITDAGSLDAATGIFTFTKKVIGTYQVIANIEYKNIGANSVLLGNGCPATTATPLEITVTPIPSKPTITITAATP